MSGKTLMLSYLKTHSGLRSNPYMALFDIRDRYDPGFTVDDVFAGIEALGGRVDVYKRDAGGRPVAFSLSA